MRFTSFLSCSMLFLCYLNAFRSFSMLFNAFHCFPSFLDSFSMLVNAFHAFPKFCMRFSMSFNDFLCFSMLCSMLFQCFSMLSMLFNAPQSFSMLFQCFSMLSNPSPKLFPYIAVLFNGLKTWSNKQQPNRVHHRLGHFRTDFIKFS